MKLISNVGKFMDEGPYKRDFYMKKFSKSRNTISNWANGHSYPSAPELFELAKLFNCKVDDLYTRADEYVTPKEEFLQTGIERLNLSTRVYHALKRNEIYTYGDLINKEITKRSGLGTKSQEELNAAIKQIRMELEEIK